MCSREGRRVSPKQLLAQHWGLVDSGAEPNAAPHKMIPNVEFVPHPEESGNYTAANGSPMPSRGLFNLDYNTIRTYLKVLKDPTNIVGHDLCNRPMALFYAFKNAYGAVSHGIDMVFDYCGD